MSSRNWVGSIPIGGGSPPAPSEVGPAPAPAVSSAAFAASSCQLPSGGDCGSLDGLAGTVGNEAGADPGEEGVAGDPGSGSAPGCAGDGDGADGDPVGEIGDAGSACGEVHSASSIAAAAAGAASGSSSVLCCGAGGDQVPATNPRIRCNASVASVVRRLMFFPSTVTTRKRGRSVSSVATVEKFSSSDGCIAEGYLTTERPALGNQQHEADDQASARQKQEPPRGAQYAISPGPTIDTSGSPYSA